MTSLRFVGLVNISVWEKKMVRGRQTRAQSTAAKRKTDVQDETTPAKLQREDSDNADLRPAISEVKAATSIKEEKKTHKPDQILLRDYPKATVYGDYTCMLYLTNMAHNNNNWFYVIQVVQDKKTNICFTRWGRVGEEGRHKTIVEKDVQAAINTFKRKFEDKTENDWEERKNFTPQPGRYTMVEIDDNEGGILDVSQITRTTITSAEPCPLDARTMLMIKIIFSEEMFTKQMSAMHLDTKKMPLEKLSNAWIAKGLEVLLDLEAAIISRKPRQVVSDLSSEFYTHCPHTFGHALMMDKYAFVQVKKEVVLILSDIELAYSLQNKKSKKGLHPLLEKYNMLQCEMELLDKNSDEYKLFEEYSLASPYRQEGTLLDIWKIDRKGEKKRFQKHAKLKNRKLLWYGDNIAQVAAILKAGLRIKHHELDNIGKGLCFGSAFFNSCFGAGPHRGRFEGEKNVGFMFLVEVALGEEKSITQHDYSLTRAPPGFDSVVAIGSAYTEPDPEQNRTIVLDGKEVIVPVGRPAFRTELCQSDFLHSKYVVYKESQARLRYMLKFSFANVMGGWTMC